MEKEKKTMWNDEMEATWWKILDEVESLKTKGVDISSIRIVCEDGRTE